MTTGCLSGSMPNYKQIAAFEAGGPAIITMGFDGDPILCGTGVVHFKRQGSERSISITAMPDSPGAAVVEPGKYYPEYATCSGGNFSYTLPGPWRWFLPVEVKANEVLYLGTFAPRIVAVETRKSELDIAGDALSTLGLSLLMQKQVNVREFPTYQFDDKFEQDRENLKKGLGAIADKLERRFPFPVLSPKAFAEAYRRAYAPLEDGKPISDAKAEARLDAEIEKAIDESLKQYLPKRPEPPAPRAVET